MSDTPETDAELERWPYEPGTIGSGFARMLERRNEILKRENAALRKQLADEREERRTDAYCRNAPQSHE